MTQITPMLLLKGYSVGIFPMAEHQDDPEIFWVDPPLRGVFPLSGFHISRSLVRALKRSPARLHINRDFEAVMAGCADRVDTWINAPIRDLYTALHDMGHAHSIELWQEDELVGGVYGVTLGTAFFGESMFSRVTNASKMVLAGLVHHLNDTGFTLFDTQYLTPHLASLGAVEISRQTYHRQLDAALSQGIAEFDQLPPSLYEVIQRSTQTS